MFIKEKYSRCVLDYFFLGAAFLLAVSLPFSASLAAGVLAAGALTGAALSSLVVSPALAFNTFFTILCSSNKKALTILSLTQGAHLLPP